MSACDRRKVSSSVKINWVHDVARGSSPMSPRIVLIPLFIGCKFIMTLKTGAPVSVNRPGFGTPNIPARNARLGAPAHKEANQLHPSNRNPHTPSSSSFWICTLARFGPSARSSRLSKHSAGFSTRNRALPARSGARSTEAP